MPGPILDTVETDRIFPEKADVVVIGGGIIGVSTALFLAERGVDVVLCEKGVLGGEQSSRNWGWVRIMGRDRREIPLAIEALKIWDGLDERVGGSTGFYRSGIVYLSSTEQQVSNRDAWLGLAQSHGLDTRQLGSNEVAALFPDATRRYRGALYTPSDARAEPQKAVPAIAAGARRLGARLLTGCAVRGIEKSAGRISAVVTEMGRIETSSVVLAGGAWSRLFCKGLGLRLPQLKVLSSVLRTKRIDGGPDGAGAADGYAFRKRWDGGYTISDGGINHHAIVPDSFFFFKDFLPAKKSEGQSLQLGFGARSWQELSEISSVPLDRPGAFERQRILDPAPDKASTLAALKAAGDVFPALKTAQVEQVWAGLIDVTPDAVPIIANIDSVPGLTIATGFSGHGFGIGPGAGHLVADLVTGNAPIVDPSPFRFTRFSDGTPLEIAPHV